jgi:hypothetical protein
MTPGRGKSVLTLLGSGSGTAVPEHQDDGNRSLQKCYSKDLKTAVHLIKWKMRKKLGMFTVNMTQNGNCEELKLKQII